MRFAFNSLFAGHHMSTWRISGVQNRPFDINSSLKTGICVYYIHPVYTMYITLLMPLPRHPLKLIWLSCLRAEQRATPSESVTQGPHQ